MLSVGSGAPRFSPSQNICVILSLPSYGNVHYRRYTLEALRIQCWQGDDLSSRIVFLLSRMSPFIRRCAGAGRVRTRPTGYRRDDP
jgi:hypothetical protein